MNKSLHVLITGTNKGLGYDLVKIFLKKSPQAIIYATSREDPIKAYEHWSEFDINKTIRCKKLEVTSIDSINQLVKELSLEKVSLDIVINNAGVCHQSDDGKNILDLQNAKLTFATNTLGPINLTKALLPLLSQTCKVVNVSSLLGALMFHPQSTQKRFSDQNINEQDILKAVAEYLRESEQKQIKNWYIHSYGTSKMLLNAWSRFILQKKWLKPNQKALCCAPGFCKTPMTAHIQDMPMTYTSYSGALRIYQTAIKQGTVSEIFYHRLRESDYFACGEGLPFDQSKDE